jgi:isoleucyl-tRNA synthetase
LSNWYVRLNRKRYWGGEMTTDKLAAYQTLYQCLKTVALLMAPVAPFYSDRLYRDLTHSENSVHLANFPKCDESAIDKQLEQRMQTTQDITSMVLSLRRKQNLKVRQPLQAIMVPVLDEQQRADIEAVADLIKGEVNVKEIKLVGNDAGILVKRVKPDFKKLGPKYGKVMKALAAKITGMSQAEISQFEKDGQFTVDLDGQQAVVELADVEIISEDIPGWLVANEGNLTVALDITVTDALRLEGIARELVNRIQNVRKSKDFDITDKINVTIAPDERTDEAVKTYGDYIAHQVLANSITIGEVDSADAVELDMDGWTLPVKVEKA